MAGTIHQQPGSGGRRSAQGSAIGALSCQLVAGSVRRRRMGQAGGLPLPLGGEAVEDPRRSAQRASGRYHAHAVRWVQWPMASPDAP